MLGQGAKQEQLALGEDEVGPRGARLDALGERTEPHAGAVAGEPPEVVGARAGMRPPFGGDGGDAAGREAVVVRQVAAGGGHGVGHAVAERGGPAGRLLRGGRVVNGSGQEGSAGHLRAGRRRAGRHHDPRLQEPDQGLAAGDREPVAQQRLAVDQRGGPGEVEAVEGGVADRERRQPEAAGDPRGDTGDGVRVGPVEPDQQASVQGEDGRDQLVRERGLARRQGGRRRARVGEPAQPGRAGEARERVEHVLVDDQRSRRQRRAGPELDQPPAAQRAVRRERVPVRVGQQRHRQGEGRVRVASLPARDELRGGALELHGGGQHEHVALEPGQA